MSRYKKTLSPCTEAKSVQSCSFLQAQSSGGPCCVVQEKAGRNSKFGENGMRSEGTASPNPQGSPRLLPSDFDFVVVGSSAFVTDRDHGGVTIAPRRLLNDTNLSAPFSFPHQETWLSALGKGLVKLAASLMVGAPCRSLDCTRSPWILNST